MNEIILLSRNGGSVVPVIVVDMYIIPFSSIMARTLGERGLTDIKMEHSLCWMRRV